LECQWVFVAVDLLTTGVEYDVGRVDGGSIPGSVDLGCDLVFRATTLSPCLVGLENAWGQMQEASTVYINRHASSLSN